jgi:hypothetical protein
MLTQQIEKRDTRVARCVDECSINFDWHRSFPLLRPAGREVTSCLEAGALDSTKMSLLLLLSLHLDALPGAEMAG